MVPVLLNNAPVELPAIRAFGSPAASAETKMNSSFWTMSGIH